MLPSNLMFFDKLGESYNLVLDTSSPAESVYSGPLLWPDGVWKGKNYLTQTSINLFDTVNIFVLEHLDANTPIDRWGFPELSEGQSITVKWKTIENADNMFLYTIQNDPENDDLPFISRQESITISFSDFDFTTSINLSYPLQVNVAFNPTEEIAYTRTLQMYFNDGSVAGDGFLIMEMEIYGEGTGEDERFRVWLENFGIKFNQEDALILKDYDLKEGLPDWKQINQTRKELLVNRDQVFPYVGTYKGLVNIINLLGYKDVLKIKEYWKNINKNSPYFEKMAMVDITDLLDDGKIDSLNLVTLDKDIKDSQQFKKTAFLALVYEFTKESGSYDEDGVPEVVETTEFEVNEIFYKLNRLSQKLKNEFLPVNVVIKDVIGEFIYFEKISIRSWTDQTVIYEVPINNRFNLVVKTPNTDSMDLRLEDIKTLYKNSEANQFPFLSFNTEGNGSPYDFNQKYPLDQIENICNSYASFYESLIDNDFSNHGKRPEWQFSDDHVGKVGCPVVFELEIPEIRLSDLTGITIEELASENMTIKDGRLVNLHEIEWTITKPGPNPYYFNYRGLSTYLYRLPHILPYHGTYLVEAKIHDHFGGKSFHYLRVTVNQTKPYIVAVTRVNDKFNYRLKDLHNLQIKDMAGSYVFDPNANITDNEDSFNSIDMSSNLFNMWEYINHFGIGRNMFNIEVLDDDTGTFKAYDDDTLDSKYKRWWGVAEGQTGMRLKDLDGVQIKDMFHTKIYQNVWCWDFLNGFYLERYEPGTVIQIGGYVPYTIPQYSNLSQLVTILNETEHPALSQYNFSVERNSIHAQAKYHSKQLHHAVIINPTSSTSSTSGPAVSSPAVSSPSHRTSKYTFFEPVWALSENFIDHMVNKFPNIDRETFFLSAPTSDIISGVVSDPQYWINKKSLRYNEDLTEQTGFLKSVFDENSLSMSQIKITDNQIIVPKYLSVFFLVNSVWGKTETTWYLRKRNSDSTFTDIITIKGGPFFIFRFPETGDFYLKAEVKDNNGNIHELDYDPVVKVLSKDDYIESIEDRLNSRKVKILKNG